jgi:hypothetical protein
VGRLDRGETVGGFTDVFFMPLLVNDLAEVLLTLIEREATGILHLASKDRYSKFAFARSLAAAFGYDPELVYSRSIAEAGLKAPRRLDTSLDSLRFSSQFSQEQPSVVDGLQRLRRLYEGGHLETIQTLRAPWEGHRRRCWRRYRLDFSLEGTARGITGLLEKGHPRDEEADGG